MRYQYDAYGSLERETDLVNGRIDRDQYDMTGRLVQRLEGSKAKIAKRL